MKIAMLSISDWAGSGFKTAQAINRHTPHEVHLIALKGNQLGHPRMDLVSKKNIKRLQKIVDHADIIHLKGDWPPSHYNWIKLRGKPIICTVSGGFFRKKSEFGQERYKIKEFQCELLTAMTPDLCYRDDMVWTPHPIDSMDKPNLWEMRDPPLFIHSPTYRKGKDTDFILKVFAELKKKINFDVRIIEGVTFEEAVELRKDATIFFDQFKCGFYGNSAIEAMQYGIPVAAYLKEEYYDYNGIHSPVIDLGNDSKENLGEAVELLERLIYEEPYLSAISESTKKYCDAVHSYQAIAKLWDELYKRIL